MFVSANYLTINYGVDNAIAKFFADREPPSDNLYWKGKLMYLRPQAGWLFIPLITDLFFKSGVSRSDVLSESFISLLEKICHFSAEEEFEMISHAELLLKVIELAKEKHVNGSYLVNLLDFMNGGNSNPFTGLAMPFKALHRGDVFLFSLCAIEFDDSLQARLVQQWFALISTLLLLDDAEDLEADKISGQENAFIESGLMEQGANQLKEMIVNNLAVISLVNKPLAFTLNKKIAGLAKSQLSAY